MNQVAALANAINCNDMQLLSCKVSAYIRASLSDNSRQAYQADLKHFNRWGGTIPTSPEVVAQYLAGFAGVLAVATLSRRLVSIGKAHTSQGYPNPTTSPLIRATLSGIRNTHGSAQRQVTPAIREDILLMVRDLAGIKGIRDRALLLLGFAGAFRRSELVALTVADIEYQQQGSILHLRRSKTDQQGQGRKIAIPYARGSVCAVQALKDWLAVSNITDGPIFRPINRHRKAMQGQLSAQSVALIVKERARAVGMNPASYAGHSLRAGLVTSAAQMGVSSWKIRAQTGHKSDAMLSRYIRDANIFVDNAAGAVL